MTRGLNIEGDTKQIKDSLAEASQNRSPQQQQLIKLIQNIDFSKYGGSFFFTHAKIAKTC